MSVVPLETPAERKAIKFVQAELKRRIDAGLVKETAEILDVDDYGVETLSQRSIHLDESYRIAAALGVSEEFAKQLAA